MKNIIYLNAIYDMMILKESNIEDRRIYKWLSDKLISVDQDQYSDIDVKELLTEQATYKVLRKIVLLRDQHKCHYCGDIATEIDHIISFSLGGNDDIENLVACCGYCNRKKGIQSKEDFNKNVENDFELVKDIVFEHGPLSQNKLIRLCVNSGLFTHSSARDVINKACLNGYLNKKDGPNRSIQYFCNKGNGDEQ